MGPEAAARPETLLALVSALEDVRVRAREEKP